MPIHDLGYRRWKGTSTPQSARWWVMAESGISAAWKSSWLRRMLFFAWIPAFVWGFWFFGYEHQVIPRSKAQGVAITAPDLRDLPLEVPPKVISALIDDAEGARSLVWSFLLFSFFRAPQAFLLVVLVGLVAPALISRDVRSRAFLLYFSRPITRLEYLLGKSAVVWFYTAMITTLPALLLFLLALLLSSDLSVLADTWHLPLRVLLASMVLIVPTTAIALAFSSLTRESRFASFAWFAVWAMSWATYALFRLFDKDWPLLSLFHGLGILQAWVFGFADPQDTTFAASSLWGAITAGALLVLYRQISAPMRV
jgi:hypothetical protein